jgi:hypothetical protein
MKARSSCEACEKDFEYDGEWASYSEIPPKAHHALIASLRAEIASIKRSMELDDGQLLAERDELRERLRRLVWHVNNERMCRPDLYCPVCSEARIIASESALKERGNEA